MKVWPILSMVIKTRRKITANEEAIAKDIRETTKYPAATVAGQGTRTAISVIDMANGDTDF